MTRIFICIPWFHPAFRAGGPVQSIANLVNEFTDDIEYKIFCSNTDLNNITLDNIETDKWVQYNLNTQVWYSGPVNRSRTLVQLVEEIKPDILYIIGIYSWHFNVVPLVFCKSPRKIISVRGMLHPGALSQKRIKKTFYLNLFKVLGLHKKISYQATDSAEKIHIEKVMGKEANIFIAGNFPHKFLREATSIKKRNELSLISVALISPMKNHLLILQALQLCTSIIEYHICGPVKDMVYWQLCLQQIKLLNKNITVHYHGEVLPGMVQEMIKKGHVFILPSKSENYGHAFYEALSAGKPVITSNNTPWLQLSENHAGINVLTEVEAIKNAIEFFAAMQQDEYDSWSAAASAYALASVDFKQIKLQYEEMFFENKRQ